jgi:hypothetical protein
MIFLPGVYNLTNSTHLLEGETVIVGSSASIINWDTLSPLFVMTNNVTFVLDGTIADAYAPGNPIEQDAIGVLPTNGPYAVATNVLITGHGSIYGS